MPDPTTWTNVGEPTQDITETVPGLTPGTQYDFEIIATNSAGTATSAPITVTTLSGTLPAPVTGLSATQPSTSSITLTWNASTAGTTPISFQPQVRQSGTTTWSSFGSPISGTVEAITGLLAGTSYDFQIIATNPIGSATSATITASTQPAIVPPTTPSTPSVLTVGAITTTTIDLSWAASSGTAPITYQPQARVTGQSSWVNFGSPTNGLSTTFGGLAQGTQYDLRVVASNVAGSTASSPVTATTVVAGTAPTAPTNLTITAITPTSASLSWSASSGSAPISYQAQYRQAGQTAWLNSGPPVMALSATVVGLSPGLTYDFRVLASNSIGSFASATQTAATTTPANAPSAPGTPIAWIITPSSVSLTWTASAGTAPISYTIKARVTGTTAWTLSAAPSTATAGSVSGLVPGTDYDFQIVASNTAGTSASGILTILAPTSGVKVTAANYKPAQILKAADLDASFDSKLDITGGTVGPLHMPQTGTGGFQPAMLALSRTAGGVSDAPLISGTYTAVMADGPVIPYSSVAMTLTLTGDSSANGPAGNVQNVLSTVNISALRSSSVSPTGPSGTTLNGSQHSAVSAVVTKAQPASGVPSGRVMSDGCAILASATDTTGLPTSQGGSLIGINAPFAANGRDDVDLRYGARILYGEATQVSSGGIPLEISRGLTVGSNSSTAYAKVIVEAKGNFSSAGLDLRNAFAFVATITSSTPGAPVTTLSVDKALGFASAGTPPAAVTASNPMTVTINSNTYNVVSVSLTPGSGGGVLSFSGTVSAADAAQGNIVYPASHSIWLSEGGNGALPGDLALNRAGTSKIYYDPTGGGATIAAGSDRISFRATSSARLPVGTTAQRPVNPTLGEIRANSDNNTIEQWQPTTSSWVTLGSGGGTTPTGSAPGPATAVIAGTATSVAVPLSWSAPITGGAGPYTYLAQYRVSGTSAWTAWGGPQTATTTTISGLSPGTRYDFQVLTANSFGSSASPITSATTLAVVPAAPTNLSSTAITSTTVALAWTASASGTPPISYTPNFRVSGTSTWTQSPGGSTTGTSGTVTGLSPDTAYDFEVVASNAGGSAASSVLTVSTGAASTVAPSVPTGVSATSPTSSSLTVSWTAPATGTPPLSYMLNYRPSGQSAWTQYGSAVTTTSVTVSSLSAATSYDFEVVATNSAGSSTSAVATGTTAATPPATTGTVSGSETSGTTPPIISGPSNGSLLVSSVLPITGITITDPTAATASGSCTLKLTCSVGTLSSTVAGAQVSGSGSRSITYANTFSACQTVAADVVYTSASTTGSDNIVVSLTDQAGLTNSISIAIAITASSGGGGTPGGPIPTDATGVTAKPAQIMLNGFGVNTKIDSAPYQTAGLPLIENAINSLGGVKILRDGSASANDSTWWTQVAQATNTTFVSYIPMGNASDFDFYFNNVGGIPSQYLLAFEGCQEADTGASLGFAETLQNAATFQQSIWQAAQAYGIPAIQMSFGQGFDVNPSSGNYGTVGNLSAFATYGNQHAYWAASPVTNFQLSNSLQFEASLPTPGKPIAITEFGWQQQATSGYNCVSPTTAAVYLLEMIFQAFAAGCPYYIWNGLLDDDPSSPIGLFDNTGAPRKTAMAIKNLFTLLQDTNSNATTLVPGKLNYSISNLPSNGGGSTGGYTALLQKSDGSFWLAIWNEQQLNNTSTGADISVAPVNITLTLGTTATSIAVYDPTNSVTPIQTGSNVTSLTISLPARVLLVKIVRP